MAIVKIHAIKTTLNKALDYIMNSEKTNDKLLIDGNSVTPETAALEFQMTVEIAKKITGEYKGKNKNLAYHLVHSLAKDDNITAEEAHELGKLFADEFLKGKYEYVIATHVDKENIHNHIIFNATSCKDYKKFNSHKKIPDVLRAISNKLCSERNLATIEPGRSTCPNKSHYEWQQHQQGTSWKSQLATGIDDAVIQANDFEDFLKIMEAKNFEYKHRGKTISFKHKDQERFTRLRTLGPDYEEENLIKRILADEENKEVKAKLPADFMRKVETEAKRKGYASDYNKAIQLANTINCLQENHIGSFADFDARLNELQGKVDQLSDTMKQVESKLNIYKSTVAKLEIYHNLKLIRDQYEGMPTKAKSAFYENNQSNLEMLMIVEEKLVSQGINLNIDTDKLLGMVSSMDLEKANMYAEYKNVKSVMKKIEKSSIIVREILGEPSVSLEEKLEKNNSFVR